MLRNGISAFFYLDVGTYVVIIRVEERLYGNKRQIPNVTTYITLLLFK